MRLIDADALLMFDTWTWFDEWGNFTPAGDIVNTAPTIDAEPIVRCTDCDDYVEFAYWFDDEGKKRDCHYCTFHSMEVHGDDFCSWAKRKEQTNDKTD